MLTKYQEYVTTLPMDIEKCTGVTLGAVASYITSARRKNQIVKPNQKSALGDIRTFIMKARVDFEQIRNCIYTVSEAEINKELPCKGRSERKYRRTIPNGRYSAEEVLQFRLVYYESPDGDSQIQRIRERM